MYENNIACFGCQKIIVSDNDIHLLNEVVKEMITLFTINDRNITFYHLETNGLIKKNQSNFSLDIKNNCDEF